MIDPRMFENRTEAEIKYLRRTMTGTKQISCDMEFTREFKEYPEYAHFNFVMFAYYAFETSGVLPFPGSLSEQPAQIMEIFETILALDTERQNDAQQKAKAEQDKNGSRR